MENGIRISKIKNSFQSPVAAGFWAVGLCCLFCFALWEPVYLTNDDANMRGILSGTHFPGIGPSEFTWCMSTVLGLFIKALYLRWPGINCYEVFFYFVLSGSTWVTIYTVAKAAQRADYKYYLLTLVVLPCILAVPFLGRQFTMVAALVACSGLLVFYSLFFKDPLTVSWAAKGLYVVFALWLGSLIRFDTSLSYGLVGGLYLLPLLPWRNIKKTLALAVVTSLALIAVFGTEHINQAMISKNSDWQYRNEMFRHIQGIYNNSIFTNQEEASAAWRVIEKANISFTDESSNMVWGKDYYSLLLTWALLGEIDVSNPSNMANVSKMLGPKISNLHNKKLFPILYQPIPSDKISNYAYILLPILLLFRSKKVWALSFYFAICFFLVSALISFQVRPLPFRLWYGYVVLFFSFLVLYIGTNYQAIQDKQIFIISCPETLKNIVAMLLMVALVYAGYGLIYKQQRHGRMLLRFTSAIEADIQKLSLDKNLIYLIDGGTFYLSTVPLRPDPWPQAAVKRIIFTTTIFSPESHEVLKRFDVPLQNTIKNICRREDVRFLFAPKSWFGVFSNPAYSPFMSMANFVRERYDLEIEAVDVTNIETDELMIFQASTR